MYGSDVQKKLEEFGLTAYRVHKDTGLSRATLGRLISENRKANSKTKSILVNYFNDKAKELRSQSDSSKSKTELEKQTEAEVVNLSHKTILNVPLVNKYAYAGFLGGHDDEEYINELPTVPFINDLEAKGNYLCFEVKGDSMDNGTHDSLLEGDVMLCREISRQYWRNKLHINKWDFVIVHKTEGILIKRIINHNIETHDLTLHSLNEFYEDFTVNLNDVAIIFNVVRVVRSRNRR